MARDVDRTVWWPRLLTFVVVLGLAVGIAVLAAHQEEADAGIGIAVLGVVVLGGVLWFVAWLRGAWHLHGGKGALLLSLAGLVAVGSAGSTAVSEAVLAARGEPVDVVVTRVRADDRNRVYALTPVRGTTPVRGDLNTRRDFDDGEVVTVLVDRGGFARPVLPADMGAATFIVIALLGVGLLAVSMIGFGFPLDVTGDDRE